MSGTHPELHHLQDELSKRRNKRLMLAERKREYEIGTLERKRKEGDTNVWNHWEVGRTILAATMRCPVSLRYGAFLQPCSEWMANTLLHLYSMHATNCRQIWWLRQTGNGESLKERGERWNVLLEVRLFSMAISRGSCFWYRHDARLPSSPGLCYRKGVDACGPASYIFAAFFWVISLTNCLL